VSTHKKIDKICIVVLVLMLILTVAFMNGERLGIRVVADEDAESCSGTAYFTANDQDGAWTDNAYTTYITLNGAAASVSGSGAYAYDGGVVISNGGWYVITGTLTDGSIVVDTYSSSKVWLRLEGVDITCSDDACLIVDQADKVFLTLADGSVNTFTSGAAYSSDALEDNTGGVIFTHDDLTINGSGALTITAGYKHGIDANDSLVITGGSITITAPQDGIHVNDDFRFTAADLTVSAGDDAIRSDKAIYVESGTILIPECCEGLEAVTVDIVGGDITICPIDDGINASGAGGSMMNMQFGRGAFGASSHEQGDALSGSAQAADSTADSDDETYIRISGGTITIVNESGRDADGLDSNGSIFIDGGDIRISLTGDGGNNALDYGSENGGELVVTGGTIVACGGSSMAEEFSSSSTQCAVLYNFDSAAAAGTAFRVSDEEGNEVLSYTPPCSYSSVAFSAPQMSVGRTFMVCVGETGVELTPDETATLLGTGTGMNAGTQPGDMNDMTGLQPSDQDGRDMRGSSSFEHPTQQRWDSESGTDDLPDLPQDGGGAFDSAERPTLPDEDLPSSGAGLFADAEQSVPETAENSPEKTSVSAETWLWLGVSGLVLAAGILFAVRWKRG